MAASGRLKRMIRGSRLNRETEAVMARYLSPFNQIRDRLARELSPSGDKPLLLIRQAISATFSILTATIKVIFLFFVLLAESGGSIRVRQIKQLRPGLARVQIKSRRRILPAMVAQTLLFGAV